MVYNQRIPVVLVDDEPTGLARLRAALRNGAVDRIEIVGEATSGTDAIAAILTERPKIVFLDIQMTGVTGLDVVRVIPPPLMPVTVFMSAYDEFAMAAFNANAVDYVLKPYTDDRLLAALKKATALMHGRESAARQARGGDGAREISYRESFAVRRATTITRVPVPEVEWIEADGDYLRLHRRPSAGARSPVLVQETLSSVERSLDPREFTRVHRSHIVNRRAVAGAESLSRGAYQLVLASGVRVLTSRGYRDAVRDLLGTRIPAS